MERIYGISKDPKTGHLEVSGPYEFNVAAILIERGKIDRTTTAETLEKAKKENPCPVCAGKERNIPSF